MNLSSATKVVAKADKMLLESSYSIGFCRMTALTKKARKGFATACILDGLCVTEITETLKEILSEMTQEEFKSWVMTNG